MGHDHLQEMGMIICRRLFWLFSEPAKSAVFSSHKNYCAHLQQHILPGVLTVHSVCIGNSCSQVYTNAYFNLCVQKPKLINVYISTAK